MSLTRVSLMFFICKENTYLFWTQRIKSLVLTDALFSCLSELPCERFASHNMRNLQNDLCPVT